MCRHWRGTTRPPPRWRRSCGRGRAGPSGSAHCRCRRRRSCGGTAADCSSTSVSASARFTDTSCDTPRSSMVTPNRRCMRAMVSAWWVMIRKRVSVRSSIASSRLQKRSTLWSSSGASTSSSTQMGEGLVRNTAKISDRAVSVCSPPDSSDSVVGFLPGGLAMISRPASSGSSDSISCSSALPPPNSVVKSSPNFWFTVPKASSRRWRPSRLRLEMPPRSLLMAWIRSSRSLIRPSSCLATSSASSSARRLTPPSRSRSSRRPCSLRSISCHSGSCSGSRPVVAITSSGSHCSVSAMRRSQASQPLRAGFEPGAEPGMLLARGGQQFLHGAQVLVGLAHVVLGRLQRVGGGLASPARPRPACSSASGGGRPAAAAARKARRWPRGFPPRARSAARSARWRARRATSTGRFRSRWCVMRSVRALASRSSPSCLARASA